MEKKKYYLGIDQGTTGTTAVLFASDWTPVSRGYQEIHQYYPQEGWVEHDPLDILSSVRSAVQQALCTAGIDPDQILCIGLDHEGESVMVWDSKTGQPLYPAVVWQDRRTASMVDEWKENHNGLFFSHTGLQPDAYFSASKLKWILDFVDPAREKSRSGRLIAGNMDAWIIWNLTGHEAHVTDASTASRTMYYNLHSGTWDQEILSFLNIDERILPRICDSAGIVGQTKPDSFLGIHCPISSLMADQQAALFGQGCTVPGQVKATYGTGCFMLMNTGDTSMPTSNGILTTTAWQIEKKRQFALDGGVYITGAAVQWLRDGLQIISSASETEELAWRAGGNGGVYFVPAFAGLAAPYWDSYARGTIVGITGGTKKEHLIRATLESTAYQIKDVLEAMEKAAGISISELKCDGGACKNSFLMQFQADILGIPLDVAMVPDMTAMGTAAMAALGIGVYKNIQEMGSIRRTGKRYEPGMSEDQRGLLLDNWHRAVDRAAGWAKADL